MNLKECLVNLLNSSDTVFIVGHNEPDFDALGSCIGVSLICEKYNKKSYVVVEEPKHVGKSISIVLDDMKKRFNVINSNEVKNVCNGKSLLIIVDTNKGYMIKVNPNDFDDVLIIDHHETDSKSVNNSYQFINTHASSACEIVESVMNEMNIKFEPKHLASYMYAGIKLDTKSYDKATEYTHESSARLIKKGADPTFVSNLFAEDFQKDRLIQKLVEETKMFGYSIAVACQNSNMNVYYEREDLAKAADYLLKFNINASFVIGKLDENNYYISSRSKGLIDVGNIMSKFERGGGNLYSAAALIPATMSLEELENILLEYLEPDYAEENINIRKRVI